MTGVLLRQELLRWRAFLLLACCLVLAQTHAQAAAMRQADRLELLNGVSIAAPSDGQVLTYDATAGVWKNAAPTGGGGGAYDALSPLVVAETSITGTTTLTGSAFGRAFALSGTSYNYPVALPLTGTANIGEHVEFRCTGTATLTKLVTLDAGSGNNINGERYRVLWGDEAAKLRKTGTASWSKVAGKPTAFLARTYRAASLTVTGGSDGAIATDTVALDNSPGGIIATSGGVTIPRTGYYELIANEQLFHNPVTGSPELLLHKNGIGVPARIDKKSFVDGAVYQALGTTFSGWFSAGDVIRLGIFATTDQVIYVGEPVNYIICQEVPW